MEGVRPYTEEQLRKYRKWWLNTTINDAFDRTCAIQPDKEALVEGVQRLTFTQVREQVQRAALAFLEIGVQPGSFVLFQLPNWAESVSIYLGLKKIGAIPILLLPRHGQRELDRFCSLTEPMAWIGPARYERMDYLPILAGLREKHSSLRHIFVVRDEAPPGTVSFSRLMESATVDGNTADYLDQFSPSPDDIIHMAPTGGTTGLPKLVPKTQNQHLCKAYYFMRHLEMGHDEVPMSCLPITHDAPHLFSLCVWALFGGKLVLCPSTKPKEILEHVQREKVTFFFSVPTLLADILIEPPLQGYDISSLKSFLCAAAHVEPELVKAAVDKLKVCVHTGYGSTEGAGCFTRRNDPLEVVATTYGRGMCAYDEYWIVDEEGRRLPQGQEGEIAVRGPSVVTGYYKSEEENDEVFAPDGFYHTGDIGKLDPWGNIMVLGRKKDIIRRGADSISPAAIEDLLAGNPKVLRAAVVGMPDLRLGERVCAYLQLKPGETTTLEEIVSYLKAQGASVLLLPERVEVVKELPLSAFGKADKKKIKEDITEKLLKEAHEKAP